MFKVKYAEINNPKFIQALNRLAEEKLPIKLAYDIGKVHTAVMKELDVARAGFSQLLTDYSEKDEKGEMVLLENGQPKQDLARVEELDAQMESFLNIEFEVNHTFPSLTELAMVGLKLSASDLQGLDSLFTG